MRKLIIVLSAHIILLCLVRFIAWPENLLWPYLNQNGVSYYKELFLIYSPIYWWSLSFFYKFFGIGLYQLMAFSWGMILITDILLFFVSKKKIWPVGLYIPLQIFFEGNGVWPDHLLAPLFLIAYWAYNQKKYFWVGVALGLSLMTKQTAAYVGIFIFALVTWQRNGKALGRIILGTLLVIIAVISYLYWDGALAGFWDSAVSYILFFHSRYPLQTQLPTLAQLPTLLLLVVVVVILFFKKTTRHLVPWIVFASLGIFTRFEYFHLQPALPFIALGIGASGLAIVPYFIFLILFSRFLIHNSLVEPRFMGKDIFENARAIGEVIGHEKRLLVVNGWDHYYFLTKTLPVNNSFTPSTPWTMDYPANKEKFRLALAAKPKFIVFNQCLLVKNICYKPQGIVEVLKKDYLERLKLSDGASVFEYHPMRAP
jgi:hypothetical protein